MKKYIECEKAVVVISEWLMKTLHSENMSSYNEGERTAYRTALSEILNLPAADVRPVVVCCDCKHFQVNVSPSGYLPQGVPEWECRYWCRPTDPTDFCSYGEKRKGVK